MHLAVVNLTSGGLSGGYKKYLRAMIPLLNAHPAISRLDVYSPDGVVLGELPRSLGVHTWPAADARSGYRGLKARVREHAPDVVFIPTARWLSFGTVPTVVMVRNMEPLAIPFAGGALLEIVKNFARRYAARRACAHASGVIAVSNYVREFLLENWHIAADRVTTIYHGVEANGSAAAPKLPTPAAATDDQRFLFTAGSIRPARGLEDAIGALAIVNRAEPDMRLFIAGNVDPAGERYAARLQRLVGKLGVERSVKWLGSLTPQEMQWAFTHCAAFIMTSRAEACPNTVLEAMAAGSVAVSGDNPPMPEFFGDNAWYYRSGDANDLGNRLVNVLRADPAAVDVKRRGAKERAAQFRWPETARRTVDFLARIAHGASV